MSWDEVSYVASSKTRRDILLNLDTPTTPTILAGKLQINLPNISRALTELRDKKIVVCLTPARRVGKIYALTEKGKEIVLTVKAMD